MDYNISKMGLTDIIELSLLDELDIFQNILTLKSFVKVT